MSDAMEFDYYYGIEAEQFSFYRVPRLLVKDKRFGRLSSDAKLLYGLMLDRLALSMKNGWLDEENRAYIIYATENIMEDLGCSKPTSIKVMRELDVNNGIGLIEKKRRGLGKPDIIYVKNFASIPEKEAENAEKETANAHVSTEVKNLYFKKEKTFTSGSKENEIQEEKGEKLISAAEKEVLEKEKETKKGLANAHVSTEVKNLYFKKEKTFTSESKETELQEVKDFSPSYNNISYTNESYTDCDILSNLFLAEGAEDMLGGSEDVRQKIRLNIEYDQYMIDAEGNCKWDWESFVEIYKLICDVVCRRQKILINGENYPYDDVRKRFLELNRMHVEYVMHCMQNTTSKIKNIRAYLVTALYNAPLTLHYYYRQLVQHDMHNNVWGNDIFGHGVQKQEGG